MSLELKIHTVLHLEAFSSGGDVCDGQGRSSTLNKEGLFKEEPSLLQSEASRFISIGKHSAFI